MRLLKIIVRSFDQDIGVVIARLERHARIADQTAVATELLRAAEFRKETERRQHEESKVQCERWLKPSDIKHIHLHQVRARLDGTCDWITSNGVFKRWIKPGCSTTKDRLLVVSGTHGCGKSVLASSIVVRLEQDKQHTLFFAFSSSDGSRQTSENLIRTLSWQLLHATTTKESVNTINRLRLDGQPTVSELWKAFECIVSSLAKPVYCIIDGIDECIDFNHVVFMKIVHTLGICPNLRILLLGRPHVTQAHSDNPDFGTIDITSTLLNQDIEAFINDEIAKSDILSLPELRENIFKTLKDKSDGMFLWVRLMVDDLRKSSAKSELKERLQNLPRGLEEAYQLVFLRLSQKLDKFELLLAQNVLAFTIISCRPLRFDELRYAHALHCRSSETMAQPLEEYLLLQPPQRVLDVCGGLVSITDGFLRLIHSSVRDFLIRPEDRWVCEPDRAVLDFRIDITQTHRSFAWLCLDYLRLEKEDLKPNVSQSIRTLQDKYPFLEYATLYPFYHLNRSGPPCSIDQAKIEDVLESKQSIFWVEHFAHFLFEDLTLDSQIHEITALEDRMADAGLDMRFDAIFENSLKKELTSQTQNSGGNDNPRTEQWKMFLDLVKDEEFQSYSQKQSNEATDSVLEPSALSLNHQARSANSRPSAENPSAAVSRIMDLLNGHTPLPIAHQIEIFLRLRSSLRKARVLIDPLKVLFQLILRKAPGIPVYALMAIGGFYEELEKFQEALEVYTAASKKMDHLDVPLKFTIHKLIGNCYFKLRLNMEALRFYEKAFSGQEILLGKRHYVTLRSLEMMIFTNYHLYQYTEVLRLYDRLCMGQDFVSELDIIDNLHLQVVSHVTYHNVGDHEKVAQMKKCLQATLKRYNEPCNRDNSKTPYNRWVIGRAYYEIGDYDTALKSLQLALEGYKKANGPNLSDHKMTLHTQHWIASTYRELGRHYEAKELYTMVYAESQRALGPHDCETQWTKIALDSLAFDHSALST